MKLCASALPTEVTANNNAATMSSRLRPKRSLNPPAINAPADSRSTRNCSPSRSALHSSVQSSAGKGFAPPMTTQSQPNNRPPIAATMEMSQT